MKALLKIILARNEKKVEAEINENQSGFRPGKGTREGIFNLRIVIQRYLEVQKPVFTCFIDYEKAFIRVYNENNWVAKVFVHCYVIFTFIEYLFC